jgi:hypothetical protein
MDEIKRIRTDHNKTDNKTLKTPDEQLRHKLPGRSKEICVKQKLQQRIQRVSNRNL